MLGIIKYYGTCYVKPLCLVRCTWRIWVSPPKSAKISECPEKWAQWPVPGTFRNIMGFYDSHKWAYGFWTMVRSDRPKKTENINFLLWLHIIFVISLISQFIFVIAVYDTCHILIGKRDHKFQFSNSVFWKFDIRQGAHHPFVQTKLLG